MNFRRGVETWSRQKAGNSPKGRLGRRGPMRRHVWRKPTLRLPKAYVPARVNGGVDKESEGGAGRENQEEPELNWVPASVGKTQTYRNGALPDGPQITPGTSQHRLTGATVVDFVHTTRGRGLAPPLRPNISAWRENEELCRWANENHIRFGKSLQRATLLVVLFYFILFIFFNWFHEADKR